MSGVAVSGVSAELLPVLLVLYPLLLVLDDLEPGFVRSVVNPHWFLVAIVVVGVVSGSGRDSSMSLRGAHPDHGIGGTRGDGFLRGSRTAWVVVAAVFAGLWIWWRLRAGTLGFAVAILGAVAVGAAMIAMRAHDREDAQ